MFAQTFRITGKVLDENNNALAGANVYLENTLAGTTTDNNGNFTISKIKSGTYKLIVSLLGYSKLVSEIIIEKNIANLIFTLSETSYQSEQIVVSANKYQQNIDDLPISANVFSGDKFTVKNIINFDDALRQMPGVNVTLDQVGIRGSSGYSRGAGTRVLVTLDGIPLYTGDSGEIIWNIIPLYQIERIELIKGSASSLYGSSALGGVISLSTKKINSGFNGVSSAKFGIYDKPKFVEWRWSNKLRTFNNQVASASFAANNFGVAFSFGRDENFSYRKNDWDRRLSGFIKANYNFNENSSLSIISTGFTRNRATFNFWKDLRNPLLPLRQDDGQHTPSDRIVFGMNFSHLLTQNFSISVKPSLFKTFWKDESESSNSSNSSLFRNEILANWILNKRTIIVSGLENQYGIVKSNIFGNRELKYYGIFSQIEKSYSEKLKFYFGFRFDANKLSELESEKSFSPKLGLNYKISASTIIRSMIGKGFRSPSLAEAFTSTTTSGVSVKPNPKIKSEISYSYEIGINHKFTSNSSVDLAFFNNEFYNLIEPKIDPADSKVIFTNLTRARISGIELGLNQQLFSTFNLNANYTFLNPKDLRTDKYLKYRAVNQFMLSVEYSSEAMTSGIDFRFMSRYREIDNEFVEYGIVKDGDKRVEIKVIDLNFTYNLLNFGLPARLNLSVKNLLNYYYVEMIGNLAPIRTFVFGIEAAFN